MSLEPPFGLLNLNKPAGVTSRDVVDHVVRLVRPAKVGHAGTLDPLATGVLVICIGPATRLTPQIQRHPKHYRAQFLLGRTSDTHDTTGHVLETPGAASVTRTQIEPILSQFIGRIEQTPPQFSAVRADGRRAYKLARKGKTVDIAPKTVEVHDLKLIRYSHPELELEIECGSGTYVRAIARDMGELLGCGAVMSKLVRTRVGPFRLEDARDPFGLNQELLAVSLLSPITAVAHLPRIVATPEQLEAIRHGRPFGAMDAFEEDVTVAVLTPQGQLACLATIDRRAKMLSPKPVFLK